MLEGQARKPGVHPPQDLHELPELTHPQKGRPQVHSVLCVLPWWNGKQEQKLNCCRKIEDVAFLAHRSF